MDTISAIPIGLTATNSIVAVPHKHHPLLPPSSKIPAVEMPSETRVLFEIVTRASLADLETALSASVRVPSSGCVEEVLKLVYASPAAAIKFFRWAGRNSTLSAYAWNLMIDLLGKNQLFEEMWDAIRTMKQMSLLSLATFASVFGSYCDAGRLNSAYMTFEVMNKYGVGQDIVALNSLLSAICGRANQTSKAFEYFEQMKKKIPPDGDTFAILFEGWEKEGNVAKAMSTFGEMIVCVGWNTQNIPAYDAFLSTLVIGAQVNEAIKFLKVMKGHGCLPGLKFFSNALDILIKQNDATNAVQLWDIMVGSGLVPNLIMYNATIGLLCDNNEIDHAFHFLDEMPFHGAFPDSLTYNMIFECLIKNKKAGEASRFFCEMVKNEARPTHSNCASAIAMLSDADDPETIMDIWNYVTENHIFPIEETANALLLGLCTFNRLTDLRRLTIDMLGRRIKIYSSTIDKMKNTFYKEGRSARDTFDYLVSQWNASLGGR